MAIGLEMTGASLQDRTLTVVLLNYFAWQLAAQTPIKNSPILVRWILVAGENLSVKGVGSFDYLRLPQ